MNKIIVLGDTPEIPKEYWLGNVNWAVTDKHCDQCKRAIEIRLLEATDIYDPVGGRKMLRNCCDEGRRLCLAYTESMPKDDETTTIY